MGWFVMIIMIYEFLFIFAKRCKQALMFVYLLHQCSRAYAMERGPYNCLWCGGKLWPFEGVGFLTAIVFLGSCGTVYKERVDCYPLASIYFVSADNASASTNTFTLPLLLCYAFLI